MSSATPGSRPSWPFLQAGTGVSPVGFIAAMAVSSTVVDVSPFSTNGALVTVLALACSGSCSCRSSARTALSP